MPGPASPSIRNYTIGKGIATFKETSPNAVAFRDLGNCPAFEFTPTVEKLDHFSSRTGIKSKDRSVPISTEGELKITMEEFTLANLRLAVMGAIDTDSAGQQRVSILSETAIEGEVKFTGTNDIGQKFEWHFLNVSFTPSSTVSPLSDEWGNFEVTGEVLAVDGVFGYITHIGGEDFESDSSS